MNKKNKKDNSLPMNCAKRNDKKHPSSLLEMQEQYLKKLVNNEIDPQLYNEEILDHLDNYRYPSY
jgi:hypothetical protein